MNDNLVAPEIFERYPEYAVAVIAFSGISGGQSDERSEKLLRDAEALSKSVLSESSLDELEEVIAWRAAYESFGVKPRVARVSFEALMRRIDKGLPRIDLLTDIYNAVSIIHRVPIGGENLDAYVGPPQLVIATGDEPFDTRENGEDITQFAEAGEVIWRDDLGVTCRRWNWRQCIRTRLNYESRRALFIVESLGPTSIPRVTDAANHLISEIQRFFPNSTYELRTEHK